MPMRTPIVPSRYQTLGSCLNTSALMRMANPMTPPTRELNPRRRRQTNRCVSQCRGALFSLRSFEAFVPVTEAKLTVGEKSSAGEHFAEHDLDRSQDEAR